MRLFMESPLSFHLQYMFIRVDLNHMNLMHILQPHFSKIYFNIASCLCVSFPEVSYPSHSPAEFCNISHLTDAAIVGNHLNLLDFIIVIIFEKYKL